MYCVDGLNPDEIEDEIRENEETKPCTIYGITQTAADWRSMLKNLRKDPKLPEMITRVLFLDTQMEPPCLLRELLADHKTSVNKLIKVLRLSNRLLNQILPRIEKHLNTKSDSEHQWSEEVRGAIKWMPTILGAVQSGDTFPRRFLSHVERVDFDTPENFLMLYAVLRLRYDVEDLLHIYKERDYSMILKKIRWRADSIVQYTILQTLIPVTEQYKRNELNSWFINEKMRDARMRIHQGIVRERAYFELVDWLEMYNKHRIEPNNGDYAALEYSVSTVYEYWILYELAYHLKKQGNIVERKFKDKPHRFLITQNDTQFELRYQDSYDGWTMLKPKDTVISNPAKTDEKEKESYLNSRPDFTIGEKEKRHIVLDAKYYKDELIQTGNSAHDSTEKHQMLGYLMNLSKSNSRIGVLFFLGASETGRHTPRKAITEYEYKSDCTPSKEFKLAVMQNMDMSHETSKKEILDKISVYIYEMLVQPRS